MRKHSYEIVEMCAIGKEREKDVICAIFTSHNANLRQCNRMIAEFEPEPPPRLVLGDSVVGATDARQKSAKRALKFAKCSRLVFKLHWGPSSRQRVRGKQRSLYG